MTVIDKLKSICLSIILRNCVLYSMCGFRLPAEAAVFLLSPFAYTGRNWIEVQKDPHPRNLEQGSIVILLEYLILSEPH